MSSTLEIIRGTQSRIEETSDKLFSIDRNAQEIYCSVDKKIEFVIFPGSICMAGVTSALSNTVYYPLCDVSIGNKITSVVMDLDGTTASSEKFWIEIIRQVVVKMTGDSNFQFKKSDFPFISGHSVSEHLSYCITRYSPLFDIYEAMDIYKKIYTKELKAIVNDSKASAFEPTKGIKRFILEAKKHNVKIGLVTSGVYDKAYPEILAILHRLNETDPSKFYDSIVTAGSTLKDNLFGTLGEISAKPHPWLYIESTRIGLSEPKCSQSIIGFEDSGAGVMALRLAGIPVIGIKNGNIVSSGYEKFCEFMVDDMDEALDILSARFK